MIPRRSAATGMFIPAALAAIAVILLLSGCTPAQQQVACTVDAVGVPAAIGVAGVLAPAETAVAAAADAGPHAAIQAKCAQLAAP